MVWSSGTSRSRAQPPLTAKKLDDFGGWRNQLTGLNLCQIHLSNDLLSQEMVGKLFVELCQIGKYSWVELGKKTTWETGQLLTASEALCRIVKSLTEQLEKGSSSSAAGLVKRESEKIMSILSEAGVQWPRLVDGALPDPDTLDDSFKTFRCNIGLLNNVNYGNVHTSVIRARSEISKVLRQTTQREWTTLQKCTSKSHHRTNCAAMISDIVLGIVEDSFTGLTAQQLLRAKKNLLSVFDYAKAESDFGWIVTPWLGELRKIYIQIPALPRPPRASAFEPIDRQGLERKGTSSSTPSDPWAGFACAP
ncbi:uncharacterized protein JCM6883_005876 [Sporobolomyces salmoneus]|uniref:uncharacterized protein n=1 Tax=Sporobolomyces salmoneus TaxID=183962 RepID=UPI003174E92F